MAQFDNAIIKLNSPDFLGYTGNPPVDEAEYNARKGTMFSKDAPTWSNIQAEVNKLNVDEARRNAYPLIGDQLDMIWHDKKDGTTTWEDAVQTVKDANPKP